MLWDSELQLSASSRFFESLSLKFGPLNGELYHGL